MTNHGRKVIVGIAAAFFICSLLITGCAGLTTSPTPQPMPPFDRSKLPLKGHMECGGGGIRLWEFPGIEPEPDDSNILGDKGMSVGSLEPCSSVSITRLRWSSRDREYYVYVDTGTDRGWLRASNVVIPTLR